MHHVFHLWRILNDIVLKNHLSIVTSSVKSSESVSISIWELLIFSLHGFNFALFDQDLWIDSWKINCIDSNLHETCGFTVLHLLWKKFPNDWRSVELLKIFLCVSERKTEGEKSRAELVFLPELSIQSQNETFEWNVVKNEKKM